MSDELRKWMKAKGVWQLDLCKMLEQKDVESLADFKQLSKDEVLELIDQAKKTGFMHSKKLKELHGGFPKKKKKKKKAVPKASNKPKAKGHDQLKIEARDVLEDWMRDNGIWQIDLFDLITDEYRIYTPQEFNEYKTDPDWVDEFLLGAKQCGVMGQQAITLAVFVGKRKKKKKKKKKNVPVSNNNKPRQKTHEEMKIECREPMEEWLRDNNVWQIDLFDMMVDKYQIYSVDDFNEWTQDDDWIDEFLLEAKQVGVMGNKVKHLEKLCGRRKNIKKKKKKKKIVKNNKPVVKQLTPEEIENAARDKMEPFMQDNGFWHKDLFLILLEYDVQQPSDMNSLTNSDRKEIIKAAKQKGLIGSKTKKFKAYFK